MAEFFESSKNYSSLQDDAPTLSVEQVLSPDEIQKEPLESVEPFVKRHFSSDGCTIAQSFESMACERDTKSFLKNAAASIIVIPVYI